MTPHYLPVAAAVLILTSAAHVSAQTPIRDGQRGTGGTAAIAGKVVSDDGEARPIRRARVMVNNTERTVGRTVVTDDDGTFAITGLPAGRYTLTSTKDGLVTVAYGARRVGRPGTPIVLEDGQHAADVILRIPRGAVITGMVVDENAQPLPGVSVQVLRSTVLSGERQFVPGALMQTTDDRGIYRVYGLMAGEYIVSASGSLGSGPPGSDVRTVSDADVQRALQGIRSPFMSTRPGQLSQDEPNAAAASETSTTVAYAPVYHPGVTFADQATRIALAAGEERGGVDLQMQIVPTAKVEGTVTAPAGVSPQVAVSMLSAGGTMIPMMAGHFRNTRADAQGRFSFDGVSPGQYSIVTRGGAIAPERPGQTHEPTGRQPPYWAQADIVVEGRDISDVVLSLQPGLTVTGRVEFEGSRLAPPDDLSRVRVSLAGTPSEGQVRLGVSPAEVRANGTFTIAGVTPGSYRVSGGLASPGPTPGWFLKSVLVDGQNVLDTTFDVHPTRPPGEIVVVFTDQTAVLSGTIQDAAGRPAPDYFIIAFTTDRAQWTARSRRIASIRPSADGRYTFLDIPPGEYFLAAVDDVEQGEWFDPAFLQTLVGSAMKVTIAEGEQKTQDLQLAVR